MARQLLFHALTSPTPRRCPWRTLLWSYVGATRTSKLGTPLQGKDAQIWASVPSRARMLLQRHQCSSSTTLGQGCSGQRHQCSISIGLLVLLNCNWMAPNVVPTRTIHHRFLILRSPSNLTRHLCLWCKDKSTWRQPVVYIVETGVTVFEVN